MIAKSYWLIFASNQFDDSKGRRGNGIARTTYMYFLSPPSHTSIFVLKEHANMPGSESCKPSQNVPNDIYVTLRRANCPEHQYKLHLKPNAQLLCYLCFLVTSITLLLLLLCDLCYFITLFLQLPCFFSYFVTSVTLLSQLPCYFCYLITSVTLLIACRPVVIVTQHIPTFCDRDQRDKTIALS